MQPWRFPRSDRTRPWPSAKNKPPPSPPPSTPEPARFERRRSPTSSLRPHRRRPRPRRRAPRAAEREVKESLIAADITIEGKIEGAGHVRIAGRFKGDVNVQGNLTIETGAKVTGGVRANKVIIAGELEGNIEAAQRVELVESGVLIGDVKAGTMTVAAGSRMRGQMDFGWEDKAAKIAGSQDGGRRRVMSAVRQGSPGATRNCPHCKATILDSASVCPACRGHLRFDPAAGAERAGRRRCAWRARSASRPATGPRSIPWC